MKKTIAVILCLLTVTVLFTACTSGVKKLPLPEKTDMLVIGHRGYSAVSPENTLAAFSNLGGTGAYGCEFDIHATADGKWLVMHDDDVSRMTDGEGKISELPYDVVRDFRIDAGNGIENYPDETVPNLDEALDVCSELSLCPVVEIKSCTNEQAVEMVEIIKAHGLYESAVVISFNADYLKAIREKYADLTMMKLSSKITDEELEMCKEYNFGIDFDYKNSKNISCIAKAVEMGLTCAAWTVDSPEDAARLNGAGVKYITSNVLAGVK